MYKINRLHTELHACPCGYYGDLVKPCTCTSSMVTRYQKRVSEPLMDRIDNYMQVFQVGFAKLRDTLKGETSGEVCSRVEAAWAYHRVLKLSRIITD